MRDICPELTLNSKTSISSGCNIHSICLIVFKIEQSTAIELLCSYGAPEPYDYFHGEYALNNWPAFLPYPQDPITG